MPSATRFILKDSPELLRGLVDENRLQGRSYSPEYAQQPGGIKAAEVALGLQFSCLAITDDKPDTLKNVAKANPWQQVAMELLTGSPAAAHQPLSHILKDKYALETDHFINVRGLSSAGHLLDTQGYIAHNDSLIVLAFRCTTSGIDWLTNLSTTTSAWEIDEDLAQGHSGFCSACCGLSLCVSSGAAKPRVHTGFYNNLLATIPILQKYIDPLLARGQPPRTLYVVGHSLGAGIATLAACYFLLEQERYDWQHLSHKLRVVTAGGPRAATAQMQEVIESRVKELNSANGSLGRNKVIFARVVRDKDMVPTVPPEIMGYRHIPEQMVFLTKEDSQGKSRILINPNPKNVVSKRKMKKLVEEHPKLLGSGLDPDDASWTNEPTREGTDKNDDDDEDSSDGKPDPTDPALAAVDQEIKGSSSTDSKFLMIPRHLRDHMPQFYLHPLQAQLLQDQTSQIYLDPVMANLLQQGSSSLEKQQQQRQDDDVVVKPVSDVHSGNGIARFFRFRHPKEPTSTSS